jgi:hypothetical protein
VAVCESLHVGSHGELFSPQQSSRGAANPAEPFFAMLWGRLQLRVSSTGGRMSGALALRLDSLKSEI